MRGLYPLDPPQGPRFLLGVSSVLVLIGAAVAALPHHAPHQAPGISAALEQSLLQQLAVADRQWIPRVETLPNGGRRYHYRRRVDEPPLSVVELQALMANPPTYEADRLAIGALLAELAAAGVRLELTQPRKPGAAGEWDPQAATLRIQPWVVGKGSTEFARVLNHEAIHVAQSCRNRGLRSSPRPLGLPTSLPAHLAGVLQEPLYRQASGWERRLEREAYANQGHLELGAQLVNRYC